MRVVIAGAGSVGRSIAFARPSQNLGGEDMCSAIHFSSAQGST